MSQLAFVIDPCPSPVGRLVYEGVEMRDERVYMAFSCPSESRGKHRQYKILVDAESFKTDCPCEWNRGRRNTVAGREKWGPIDLFKPVHLCHHLQRISAHCKKRKKILMEASKNLAIAYKEREAHRQREVA